MGADGKRAIPRQLAAYTVKNTVISSRFTSTIGRVQKAKNPSVCRGFCSLIIRSASSTTIYYLLDYYNVFQIKSLPLYYFLRPTDRINARFFHSLHRVYRRVYRQKVTACPGKAVALGPDWRSALRKAGRTATAATYQGETLNFATPGAFFGHLTERRWAIVQTLQQDGGTVGLRELARRLGRDVKRVHEDATELVALGLVERNEAGALRCPFVDIHVDMHMAAAA